MLFNTLEGGEVYEKYHDAISKALNLDDPSIKSLTLKEFLRTSNDPLKVAEMRKDFYVLGAILKSLGDEDLTIVQMAGVILKKIADNPSGLKLLCTQFHKDVIELMTRNSVVAFRVLEIIVDISVASKEGLQACEDAGFLNSLLSLLTDNEVLIQLNALELLTKLALNPEGLNYLERNQVLAKLSERISQAGEDPLSALLIPGLIKFFGNVAHNNPDEIFLNYPIVISSLFEIIQSEDLSILPIALDTLGQVSKRVAGKYALESFGQSTRKTLKKVSEILQKMSSEIKVRALNNLASILRIEPEEQDNRILSLTKSWFDLLAEDPLDMIVGFCKQPFADIREAGLQVLAVVASQTWGQEYMANAPGLVEFLLDRNVESFKECKEAKFQVVEILSQAGTDIFDSNTVQRFKQFVNHGPMYVETITDIATEGL